jgi:hypothetical protein
MKVLIKCEVLNYDDLPKDLQTKLLTNEYDVVREIWQYDHLIEEFVEKLTSIGFMDAKIYCSGFGNQGDGLCFDAKVDLRKLSKYLEIDYNEDEECHIEIVNTPYYNNERTRRICYTGASETEALLEELRLNLCLDFYRQLEEDIESQTSEEALLESLRSRSYVMGTDLAKSLEDAAGCEVIQII